jgi:hypothetical protein
MELTVILFKALPGWWQNARSGIYHYAAVISNDSYSFSSHDQFFSEHGISLFDL